LGIATQSETITSSGGPGSADGGVSEPLTVNGWGCSSGGASGMAAFFVLVAFLVRRRRLVLPCLLLLAAASATAEQKAPESAVPAKGSFGADGLIEPGAKPAVATSSEPAEAPP